MWIITEMMLAVKSTTLNASNNDEIIGMTKALALMS